MDRIFCRILVSSQFRAFYPFCGRKEGHPRMADVAESTLRTILKNARLRPFKVTYYCEKRDPDFKEKIPEKEDTNQIIYEVVNQNSKQRK